jgi:hypothetical protein
MLYEILAGIAPRGWNEEARPADWAARIRAATIAAPRSPQLRTPETLQRLALRALARDPESRPSDAGAFTTELRAILEAGARVQPRWVHDLREWWRHRTP